jgi:outer membrane biosynthesis protein TonB
MILWYARLHPRTRPPGPEAPEVWHIELRRLVADGLVHLTTGASPRVVALPHPRSAKWTDEAAAAITAGMRAVLLTLEERSEVPWRGWGKVGVEYGISRDHIYESARWLMVDGLIANSGPEGDRVTTSAQPRQRRTPPTTAEEVGLQRRSPKPAPTTKPAAAPTEPKPAPAAAPQPQPAPQLTPAASAPAPVAAPPEPDPEPEPEPKRAAVPSRVTTRTLAAAIVPTATATVAGDGDEESQLLRRLVFAAEVSAGLVSGPTRVRTPLGLNPTLDAQLRVAVVLCGAGRPMMASEISAYWLTPEQKIWLSPALEDGVKRGGFTCTPGRGRSGRGRRYALADVTVFDGVSWESLHAAVAAQRDARERRKLGSGVTARG